MQVRTLDMLLAVLYRHESSLRSPARGRARRPGGTLRSGDEAVHEPVAKETLLGKEKGR
jgi:hypothetical protein